MKKTIVSFLIALLLSSNAMAVIKNPMLWADVPDPDVIRVGDTFYMVSTTMHLMPGAPVMASRDLQNWETVGYIFDKLTDSPKYDLSFSLPLDQQEGKEGVGTVYGRGQWATSLKYHDGKFWALLAPNEAGAMGDTYIFTAPKAEGPWTIHSRLRHFHDATLFFDDDGTPYVFYGTGEMCQLSRDLKSVVEGSNRHYFQREADERGLLEGTRVIKHRGTYYALLISHVFAPGRHRREVCYRTKDLNGKWEKNTILESDFGGFSYLAQGTIVDTEDGDWYGIMFQDRGGVGRVLTLSPVRWIDGWPMLGDEQGKVPATMRPLKSGEPAKAIVESDDFSYQPSTPNSQLSTLNPQLKKCWQWNHNPVDQAWSLTERPGFLRLKTSRVVPNLYLAPNTLTQRMEGPVCRGIVCFDFSRMQDGDCAGFCAFNGDSGVLTLKKTGKKLSLEMSEQKVSLTEREKAVTKVEEKVIESVDLQSKSLNPKSQLIWLRIDGDFQPGHHDVANFYYSLDGKQWEQIGSKNYRMQFDYRRFFMGSKFAIFNYATKKVGGYVDVDYFDYRSPSALTEQLVSPNEKLSLTLKDKGLQINCGQKAVMEIPSIGFGKATALSQLQFVKRISDDYRMLSGKRLHCTNEANEYEAQLGSGVKLVLRLYNDGIAFRYELEGLRVGDMPKEQTTYRIAEGVNRWMLQWSDGYEGFYPLSTTARVKPVASFSQVSTSPEGFNNRWAYPALVEPLAGVFALITEANIERRQSASCLFNDGELFRVVADQNDAAVTDAWHTPWRVVIVGSLADVVQSTLVTDVSEPCKLQDANWVQPGVVSWVYWAYNHGSNDYNIIAKYVDLAVALHLPYVLIDAEWDEMKDGKTIEDAVGYARSKGIKPMIWYNSSVGWINGAPGPKFRLNKAADREKEFAWCERIGVAGVKIDFFSGDNQMNMDYCLDLLESAARHHLLVNFHGATIPRGWQRTYPNLLSTEGVYGAEWYNNVATFTDRAASHNATLPFTRNVIGPMDYTPCAFSNSQHPHITTHAHELALTVLFESGLQHLADRPESFLAQPADVQQFLGQLPVAWDETRYVSGYPGESAVLARRSGDTWYVAGINGTDEPRELSLPLGFLGKQPFTVKVFADRGAQAWAISSATKLPSSVKCLPRGGFVYVIQKNKK